MGRSNLPRFSLRFSLIRFSLFPAACGLALALFFSPLSTPAQQIAPSEDAAAAKAAETGTPVKTDVPDKAEPPAEQGSPATTQQPPDAPAQGDAKPAEPARNAGDKPQDKPVPSGTSKDRLFFLIPNFLTLENAGNVPPLTAGQKYKVVARSTFDPFQFSYYTVIAGISQAANSEEGYGQGAQGYGKRFGAIFADTTIENFMVGAVLPSAFHQDPRYFQRGKGSFGSRTWYAITRIFVTRGDSGHSQFNASEVLGSSMAAAISTYSYHPESDRKIGNLASTWGTQLGLDSFGFMAKEFWPDLKRHFKNKKNAPDAPQTGN